MYLVLMVILVWMETLAVQLAKMLMAAVQIQTPCVVVIKNITVLKDTSVM